MGDDMWINLSKTDSESVTDILKANEEWKAKRIKQYEKDLSKFKESLKEISEEYVKVSDNPDSSIEEIKQADINLTELRIKILKLEQMIKDFKQCPI